MGVNTLQAVSPRRYRTFTLPPQTSLQEVLHENHQAARDKVIGALADSYHRPQHRSAFQLSGCANAARFYIDPDEGKVRPWVRRCKHRLCPFCGKARSMHVADQLAEIMRRMKHPRLIVLTVRSTHRPLRSQVDSLRTWLKALRRTPEWKERVFGGAYTVEITINEKTGLWHPHLHIVYDGAYFPFKLLQRLWHEVTEGSEVVWVQDVKGVEGAARELAKYIGKIQQLDRLNVSQVREYEAAVHGTRMVQAFGTSYGVKLVDADNLPTKPKSEYAVSLARLGFLAARGADTPQRLLLLIAERYPVFAPYIYHQAPQLEPDESRLRRQARQLASIEGRAPPAERSRGDPDHEKLDADLFLAFTRYRQDDEQNSYDVIDQLASTF